MKHLKRFSALGVSTVLLFGLQVSGSATTVTPAITIGVDHFDPATQNFGEGRVFAYTDFFTGAATVDAPRTATVKQGDTIDFQFAPGSFHVIAVAPSGSATRAAVPLFVSDSDDGQNPNGTARVAFDGGFFASSHCGLSGTPCTFDGSGPVFAGQIAGFGPNGPTTVDWLVTVAPKTPTKSYDFFCYIHPGMRGTLNVVSDATVPVDPTKAEKQFMADKSAGLDAETASRNSSGFDPQANTFNVHVGATDTNHRVSVIEMIPQQAILPVGAIVKFGWQDNHEPHTVGGPPQDKNLPDGFGFDCAQGFVGFSNFFRPDHDVATTGGDRVPCHEVGEGPEAIADPGQAPGILLRNARQIIDSGVFYPFFNSVNGGNSWSLTTNQSTQQTTYAYHCTVHDFMVGTFTVIPHF